MCMILCQKNRYRPASSFTHFHIILNPGRREGKEKISLFSPESYSFLLMAHYIFNGVRLRQLRPPPSAAAVNGMLQKNDKRKPCRRSIWTSGSLIPLQTCENTVVPRHRRLSVCHTSCSRQTRRAQGFLKAHLAETSGTEGGTAGTKNS